MQRVFDDTAGYYVLPPEGVTLATLGVPPYSPPSQDWDGEAPVSFADMVRTVSSAAEPDAWREDNRAPFWIPDDTRAASGPSFDDYVRPIDPRADQDIWREDNSAPRYAASDDPAGQGVPYDARAIALGAVRIPGLPDDAAEWTWHERLPNRASDAETPAQLASMIERCGGTGTPSGGGDKYIPGADAAGEGPIGPIMKGIVYRNGWRNPGSWKVKPGQDFSIRDTFSNPWPKPSTGPVFPIGKPVTEIDAAKLPLGSVVRDNIPPGHGNIKSSLLWNLILNAIKRRP